MMLSTCACTDTSSAEVGSSQTRNSGCVARARAIEMRWRCPPENWCGNFSMSALARPTDCNSSPTLARRPSISVNRPCSRRGSPTMSSTFQRGFRLAYGSWKIICMRRRRVRRLAADDLSTPVSWPSNNTAPRVGSYSPTSSRATVLLPQPDSPTSASVLPLWMLKLTPSTACTNCRGLRSMTRFNHGADTSKVFARSSTLTSAVIWPPVARATSRRRGCGRRRSTPADHGGSAPSPAGSAG